MEEEGPWSATGALVTLRPGGKTQPCLVGGTFSTVATDKPREVSLVTTESVWGGGESSNSTTGGLNWGVERDLCLIGPEGLTIRGLGPTDGKRDLTIALARPGLC